MKEVTYEDWQKNPKVRTMWVWDNDEKDMLKMTVVYIIPSECNFPVVALGENGNIYRYRHCAEIVKEQKTSKGFYVYNPAGSKPSHIHETLEEAKAEAERIFKSNLNAGIKEPIEVLEIITKCVLEIKIEEWFINQNNKGEEWHVCGEEYQEPNEIKE